MNAVQSFFKKYHAVPGTNAGPDWRAASTDALVGWADGDCRTWDTTPSARDSILGTMQAVCKELLRRIHWELANTKENDTLAKLMPAYMAVANRINL